MEKMREQYVRGRERKINTLKLPEELKDFCDKTRPQQKHSLITIQSEGV